jgi:hypothetical protein
MAITLNDNLKINVGAPVDSKYLNALNLPYTSVGAVNSAIAESQRYVGLTVNINNVEYWYGAGVTDINLVLKTAGGGTITGGTNGLGVSGQNIRLGGTLTGTTVIIDSRGTPTGIQYGGDYSAFFTNNSLVSKLYVDTVATGLNIHASVVAATTSGITLNGSPKLIDGVYLTNGMRVLVKNQGSPSTGATTNGVYIVTGGTWNRASDYDGTPAGEVTNGDLIPVTSGITNNSSLWVQAAQNPITVGVTPLIFTEFSTAIDVVGGTGITVTQMGGTHIVSLNTATQSIVNHAITGGTNGLSCAGRNLNLGGNLCCTTVVNALTNPLCLNSGTGIGLGINNTCTFLGDVSLANANIKVAGDISLNGVGGAVSLNSNSAVCAFVGNAGCINLNVTNAGSFMIGSGGTAGAVFCNNDEGIVYMGVLENWITLHKRALPDVQWVTGYTKNAISGYSFTYNNGLIKKGTVVSLGGFLTGNTAINLGTYSLRFNNGQVISSGATGQGFDSYNAYKISGQTFISVPSRNFNNKLMSVGYLTLPTGTTGTDSIAVGYQVLCCNTTGIGNVAVGVEVLGDNTSGNYNVGVGNNSLGFNATGCNNVALGASALFCNTSGCDNIAIGFKTLCLNTTACGNIAIGCQVLGSNSIGGGNIGVGFNSLLNNTIGNQNIAIGCQAERDMVSGNQNIGIGFQSLLSNNGNNNVAIGSFALANNTTGSGNVALGECAGYNEMGSNKLYIANSTTSNPLIYGDFAANCITINGQLKITGVTSGSTADDILVWNSASCLIKKTNISPNTVNVYCQASTAPYTATTSSEYIGAQCGSVIYLPASPKFGQRITVSDVSGLALLNIITICGNGKCINGSDCATVNTDYGSITLVNNTCLGLCGWSTVAFIN